jgi:cyclase
LSVQKRLVARLDVKGSKLIKGINLEGLRHLGDAGEFARDYYAQGADELVYIDIVASLYGRNMLTKILSDTVRDIFIPVTVGGGIRSLEDVTELLNAGADKIAINTAAVRNPKLIADVAHKFGSQCMILSIEAKQQPSGEWEVYTDCGRERSGINVLEWVEKGVQLGAGEVLLTSVDMEGTRNGYDLNLVKAVSSIISVPVIASGGYGQSSHLLEVLGAGADAIAIADALHYRRTTFPELRDYARKMDIPVREFQ